MQFIEGRTSAEEFLGKPINNIDGIFRTESGKIIPISLAIHPNQSRRIIINAPGVFGDIDGYSDKYKKIATYMQTEDLAAVIRTTGWNPSNGEDSPDVPIRAALQYTKEHAWEICGEPQPEIMLMGYSSGASAIAGIANQYPEVSKILLVAPSGDMGREAVTTGLSAYAGEVYIVIGENDEIVGPQAGNTFYDLAKGASHRELITIPNCGHQFKGEVNGRIMSEAPFYAFSSSEKPLFPDPQGGIKLY